jgi:single-strand DNA-binding protein
MAGETVITVVGNLTADPELRYTQNGLPVANFTIASTPRNFDRQANEWKDGEALFLRASVWREFAEHVAGSLTKGSRVIATGRLKQRSYQDREGNNRTAIELEVDEIGPSLRYATAQVTRAASGGGNFGGGQQSRPQQQVQQEEPWATPGSAAPTPGAHPAPTATTLRSDRRRRGLSEARRAVDTLTQKILDASASAHLRKTMAGKATGDRRKPRKGAKNAAPAKAIRVGVIDYKDVATLRKFISERGKIRARRITGVSVQEQRLIAKAIKNAREMALLPYAGAGR